MDCGVCGGPTNQFDGERRDLGGREAAVVCPDCAAIADRIEQDDGETREQSGIGGIGGDSGIGGYSETGDCPGCPERGGDSASGSDSEQASDSSEITVKYAI